MKHILHTILAVLVMAFLSIALLPQQLAAAPVCVQTKTITQPDGSQITICLHGDEWFNWLTDLDGNYLTLGDDGFYRLSTPAQIMELSQSRAVGDAQRASVNAHRVQSLAHRRAASGRAAANPSLNSHLGYSTFPCEGDVRCLMILVEFQDVRFSMSGESVLQHYKDLTMKDGYDFEYANLHYNFQFHDCVRNYYIQNSGNKFRPTFDIYGPVLLDNDRAYYGAKVGSSNDVRPGEMVIDACQKLDAQGVDFSNYDANGDKRVDVVMIVFAGEGQNSAGASTDCIWPHQWTVSAATGQVVTLDDVELNQYVCVNELQSGRPAGMGTMCHEFCHVLGLPDLYNTRNQQSDELTPSYFDILDVGCYLHGGYHPCGLSAYERYELGWLEPTPLDAKDPVCVELKELNASHQSFIVRTDSLYDDPRDSEYYILENRQNVGWDKYLPSHGMLVWHIDYDWSAWYYDRPNNVSTHHRIDLVTACLQTVQGAHTPFPGVGNVTEFTDDTTPAFSGWSANGTLDRPLGKPIYNIREESDPNNAESHIIRFDFMGRIGDDSQDVIDYTPSTITYTSVDGEIVAPVANTCFGKDGEALKIVSNEYRDGKGRLTFRGEVTEIGEKAFANCANLQTIVLPPCIKTIGRKAFSTCRKLTAATLSEGTETIGYAAFEECSSLKSIIIPSTVTQIEPYAFMQCVKLGYVDIPHATKEIGDKAFTGCNNLLKVYVGKIPAKIAKTTFDTNTYANATLHVKYGDYYTYRNATNWSQFANLVEHGEMAVTDISLPSSLTLKEGDVKPLTVTITPSEASLVTLIWSTSDETVAIVDKEGKVTAKAAGTAVIAVTAADAQGLSAECAVTVESKVIKAAGISLSKGSLMLTEGESSTLTATIYPSKATDKTVTWTTNDTKVATVSSKGVVTAVGAGTCRIKATTNDGTNLSEECLVTVKASVVKATSISLNRNELTLTEGETSTLKATVGPSDATDQTVSWRSSNTAVATVSSKGVVSAKGAGSCTITATTNDGTKLTDDCQVTVTPKEIPVSKITLSAKDVTIVKGETIELVATISPADATIQTLVWESADSHVVMVENGLVYAIAVGSTYVTARATDGSGVEATCLIEVIEPKILVTGIDLDCTAIMMHVDDQCTIEATVYPEEADNKNLIWTSSDIHVAMVADGFVKATGEGNCVITATAMDGSEVYAECEVIVMQGIGISAIEDDEAAAMIYNLDGTRASQLRRGILLIRRNDGRVEKVLVK